MTVSMQERYDDALEVIRKQAVRIEYLETVIQGVTRLLANVEAYDQAQAASVQQEQPIDWVQVVEVEADSFFSKTTNSRRAMWRLRTSDGRQANVFDHSDPLRDSKPMLKEADYWMTFDLMVAGQVARWTNSPIEIELVSDGSWWKVKQFKHRRNGVADPIEPDDIPGDESEFGL